MIRWTASHEHCHACGTLTLCLVRWTHPGSLVYAPTKRALCGYCAPLDGAR